MRPLSVAVWAFASLLVATSGARAQASESRTKNRKAAWRYLTYLELPARRTEGCRGLLRLGEDSVTALMRGALHPDPQIACMSLQILGELGPLAMPAEGTLHKLAQSNDAKVASAADWARVRIGNTGAFLVTDYSKGTVLAYAPEAKDKDTPKTVFENLASAWDVERLGNGNFLVTQYTTKKVAEYTPEGEEVWMFNDLNMPLDADRLPNGNTLICDTYGSRVIEVNALGKIVWTQKDLKQPYDADRLPDGHTLVTEYGKRVAEFDSAGKVVWDYAVEDAFGADRLPNGNTLITRYSGNEIIEVDAKGNVEFTLPNVSKPNEARRLANGTTVVAERSRVRWFDAKGEVLREVALAERPGTVVCY